MDGVITGGWEYVWTVYGATWFVLTGYFAYLMTRTR